METAVVTATKEDDDTLDDRDGQGCWVDEEDEHAHTAEDVETHAEDVKAHARDVESHGDVEAH